MSHFFFFFFITSATDISKLDQAVLDSVKLKLLFYTIPLHSLPFAVMKLITGHTVNIDDLLTLKQGL